MSRTSKADANWFSISANTFQYFAGTDHPEPADGPPSPLSFTPENPQDWDSCLKISNGTHDIWWGQREPVLIAQGRENALDINSMSHSITIAAVFGWGAAPGCRGDNVITIKGGSNDIRLSGYIRSTGNEADVTLDAWSDQSSELVSGVNLSGLVREDGRPITIILGRFGSKVDSYPARYKVLFWKSLGYKCYWPAKWVAVKLGLMGGKK